MKRLSLFLAVVSALTYPLVVGTPVFATPVDESKVSQAGDTQTVLAEGRAAVGSPASGGALAAKQAAVAIALRNAVEKVCGVYVAANSLTRNYQLLKDEVLTRADGYAVLKEVVSSEREGDIVRVVVRAQVSTRPLAERLKALRLTRAFRVYVQAGENVPTASVADAITEAGFPVVDSKDEADVIVQVKPRYTTTAETPLNTAAGPMTMHSVRADVTVKAVRAETGEAVSTFSGSGTSAHIALATARSEATTEALSNAVPRLSNALLTLPAQISSPLEIVVTGIPSATEAAAFADTLVVAVPGVQKVTRRSFMGNRAVYEADVLTDALPLVGRSLETAPALKRYRPQVTKETRNRIAVRLGK
jgi:hypothetical protein